MQFKCFRVIAQSTQPQTDMLVPWRIPKPAPVLTDELELRQAAIECAQLAEAHGMRVSCSVVLLDGAEQEQVTRMDFRAEAA
jgi:hypothetical protein